jgi:hypothetical protein
MLVEKQVLRKQTRAVSVLRGSDGSYNNTLAMVVLVRIIAPSYICHNLVLFGMSSVLIDDREKLKDDWEKAGGTFILHTSAKSTLDALRELGILLLQEDKVGNGVSAKESTADTQCLISNADEAKS